MSRKKLYNTVEPKKDKNKIRIKVDPLARNELHFEVQKRTRAHVFVDRRFKKPRYKKVDDDE